MLQPLNLPPYPFRITEKDGRLLLFDDLRRKEVVLTPEEWVRQHFVKYLINQKKYPKALIKLEGGLRLNGLSKRTDIVVFDRSGQRILMVECKAPAVNIDQKVFDQVARYNMAHKVDLLAVTNGLQHYYCHMDHENLGYRFIEDLPEYNQPV